MCTVCVCVSPISLLLLCMCVYHLFHLCVCVCVCVAYVLNPSVLPVFLLSSLCSVVHSIGMCGVVRLRLQESVQDSFSAAVATETNSVAH